MDYLTWGDALQEKQDPESGPKFPADLRSAYLLNPRIRSIYRTTPQPALFIKAKSVNPRTYLLPGTLAEGKVDQGSTVF